MRSLSLACLYHLEQEIDGQGFLELTEGEILTLTDKLGIKKLMRLVREVSIGTKTKLVLIFKIISISLDSWVFVSFVGQSAKWRQVDYSKSASVLTTANLATTK